MRQRQGVGAKRGGAPFIMLMAVTVLLAACASPPGSKSAEGGSGAGKTAAGAGAPVTMAGVFCVCFSNAYVAWKKGFFEQEGVHIKEFITTKSGADTFQAVAAGDAQLALNGLDAIMRGREKGLEVRSIATVSPEFYALTIRKEAASEIKAPADLKGRKVAVSKIGSASWAFLLQLLKGARLSADDVEVVQLGGIDTIMAGLKRGTVDAAVTWEPGTAQGTQQNFSKVLINALEPADHQKLYGSKVSISMTLATTDGFIKSNPDVVRGAVRALDKADAWMAGHSTEEIADVIGPLAEGLDRAVLVAAVKDTMNTMPKSADVSKAAYTDSANRLKEAGIIKEVPPVNEAFNCDIGKCTE